MDRYLLIASEDPHERRDLDRLRELATQLRRLDHEVTVFLVQNAVLAARSAGGGVKLPELLNASVEVLADEFSLHERGIGTTALAPGVRPAPIGVIVERLAAGWKTIWK